MSDQHGQLVPRVGSECQICHSPLPGPRSEISYGIAHNGKAAMEASAERGCHMCSSLWQTFSKHYGPGIDPDTSFWNGSLGLRGLAVGSTHWQIVVSPRQRAFTDIEKTQGCVKAMAKTPPPRSSSRPSSCSKVGCVWCERIPRIHHHPTGYTGSAEAIELVRSWLSRCIREHEGCGGDQMHPLPRRVLEVLDHHTARVRLVETGGQQKDKYACLSHRWSGETEKFSLKSEDIKLFQKAVPRERLSRLLKDAIWAAGELGLNYIWIDCMVSNEVHKQSCIDQTT